MVHCCEENTYLKYNLPDPETLLENPVEKLNWKKTFNTAIKEFWISHIVSQSRLYSSLKYLSKTYIVGKRHPAVKPCLKSDRDIPRIPVKNKVLTGTYILQANRVKFNQNEVNPVCQLCKEDDETLQHFLIDCKSLEEARQPILKDFVRVLNDLIVKHPVSAEYTLIQLLILDSDIVIHNNERNIDSDLRNLLDSLHYQCSRNFVGPSDITDKNSLSPINNF